jgi:hypothetical protein
MKTISTWSFAAMLVVGGGTSATNAAEFIVSGEFRNVLTTAGLEPIGEVLVSDFESIESSDPGFFVASADALAAVKLAGGTAVASTVASQFSSITTSLLHAAGNFSATIATPGGAGGSTEAFNIYNVGFSLTGDSPSTVSLTGMAVGGPVEFLQRSTVKIFITTLTQQHFFATTEALAPGETLVLNELIELPPGGYSMQVVGNVFLSTGLASVPFPETELTGAFDLKLKIVDELAPADLNGDGHVDGLDLAILLGEWGRCGAGEPCPADLNGDGTVNGMDLAELLSQWG